MGPYRTPANQEEPEPQYIRYQPEPKLIAPTRYVSDAELLVRHMVVFILVTLFILAIFPSCHS